MGKSTTKRRPKARRLEVVFDTNALYTGHESDLVREEVEGLIARHSQHDDLSVGWYVPRVVIHERRFQMLKAARKLLPSIRRLEKLLGHNLNITEEALEQRVDAAVKGSIDKLNLHVLELDVSKVEWDRLIHDSCYRRPPFEDSDKEKGFRDSLIAETFMQFVDICPSTATICRVALVTGDQAMADAVNRRCDQMANVRVLGSIEALEELVNTLVAAISEELVAKYREQAGKYFFERGNKQSLYYRLGVDEKLRLDYASVLAAIPDGADGRRDTKWLIGPPQFVKKETQKVFWATGITIEAEAYVRSPRYAEGSVPDRPSWLNLTMPYLWASSGTPSTAASRTTSWADYLSQLSGPSPAGIPNPEHDLPEEKEVLVAKGSTVFEVRWRVTVKASGKFSNPILVGIEHKSTRWEPTT